MAYIEHTSNPVRVTNDCIIRATATATGLTWVEVMKDFCDIAINMYDMPNNFRVVEAYMSEHGYQNHTILSADACTVAEFCEKHPYGRYVILTPDHALAVVGGDYYDVTDCGNAPVTDYWEIKC